MDLIRIGGAGVAGLVAGIQLARTGLRVEVHEKRADVGLRHHNDFQGLENWSQKSDVLQTLRGMGIEPDFFAHPFSEGLLYLPSLCPVRVRSRRTMFYLVKRGPGGDTLDAALKRQALEAGVRIHFGSLLAGDADIIATGPPRANIVAAGITFDTSAEDQAKGILSDVLAPKGYAYFLVAEGKATLGTVLFRDFHKAGSCLQESLAAFQKTACFDIRNPRKFGGFGYFGIPRSGQDGGKLYVGEAVGFQDSLFGFGLRYALLSGHYAAQSILTGAGYDLLWQKGFGRYLVNARVNRLLYERFTRTAYHVLRLGLGFTRSPGGCMRFLYTSPVHRWVSPFLGASPDTGLCPGTHGPTPAAD